MKIVYLLEDLDVAGGVKVVVEHAEGLAARGHDVSIATKGPRPSWIDVAVPLLRVAGFTRDELPEADVMIATWYATVLPMVAAKRAPCLFHFSQGYEAIYPHVSHLAREIDAAYAQPIPKLLISAHLVELFRERFPGPFHVLPQAIRVGDYTPRFPRDRRGEPPVIGVVGPYEALNKGIPVALRAVEALRRDRALRLHRVSQFPISEEERARFRPDVYLAAAPVGRVIDFYRELDLLIHPSFEAEGFPLPPLEAMASGVPVVLTEIPSYGPLPRESASWVAPGDSGAMAREAARLLDDGALWRERRAAGLATAATFTLERVLDELERVFAGALAARPAAQKMS